MSEDMSAIKELTANFKRKLEVNDRKSYTAVSKATEAEFLIGCINVGDLRTKNWIRAENIARVIEQCNFDIFILQETFLLGNDDLQHQPPGYDWARNKRKFSTAAKTVEGFVNSNIISGGSQLIYVREKIHWEIMSEGEFGNTNVQYLHIEITRPVQLHLIAVYSPHKNHYKLVYTLMSWYIAALPAGALVMFIGDVNINWFTRTSIQYAFSETLADRGIRQLIQSVTRPSSETCLDHIYTNAIIQVGGVVNDVICKVGERSITAKHISPDHLLIFCTVKCSGKGKSVRANSGGEERTIKESKVFMLCKLEKYFYSDRKLKQHVADNKMEDGGFVVLLECPDPAKQIDWVNKIHGTNTIEWCNVFCTTQEMVALLQEQLPVEEFS